MIQEYKHQLLQGSKCMVHPDFIPALGLFCQYLEKLKCRFHVTSSFREDTVVPGAIVDPAKKGNHLVGCAIDGNIIDPKGIVWTSTKIRKDGISGEVKQLVQMVRESNVLRWGGDFFKPDEVHFDNGLNISNPKRWKEIYDQLHPPLMA